MTTEEEILKSWRVVVLSRDYGKSRLDELRRSPLRERARLHIVLSKSGFATIFHRRLDRAREKPEQKSIMYEVTFA